MTDSADIWANGASYERYVGRWSRVVARDFLRWLSVPPGKRWLDVGCGTGALSGAIFQLASPAEIKGVDPSAGYVAYAREHVLGDHVRFVIGDGRELPVEPATYDVAVSGLALNFVPTPSQVVAQMARATRPGGVVAAYVWDYAGEMQLMRHFWNAAVALDPAAVELDEGRRFPICKPEPLRRPFLDAGLDAVEIRLIDVPTDFRDFDDYWSPFLEGQGPAPGYVSGLDDERRAALRERIDRGLPKRPDGSIHLIARAWAVRAVV